MRSMLSKQTHGPPIGQYPILKEQSYSPAECGGYGSKRDTRQEMMAYIKCYAEAMNKPRKDNPPQRPIQIVTVTMDRIVTPTAPPPKETRKEVKPKAKKKRRCKQEASGESSETEPKKKKCRKSESSEDEKPTKPSKKKPRPPEEGSSMQTAERPSTPTGDKEPEKYVTVTRYVEKTITVDKPFTLYREMTKTLVKEKPIINYKITTVTETITKTAESKKTVEPTTRPSRSETETSSRKTVKRPSRRPKEDLESDSTEKKRPRPTKDEDSDTTEKKPKKIKCTLQRIPKRECKMPAIKKPIIRGCEMAPESGDGKMKMFCRLLSPIPADGGRKRPGRRQASRRATDIMDVDETKMG